MLTCRDVGKYFLALTDEEAGDLISNLKLQKLVYYAQGFCLAIFDKALFSEQIEAWQHGPVVPELYHEYKKYASGSISKPDTLDLDKFGNDEKELMDEVYEVFGQFSALRLRAMTHEEQPWKLVSETAGVISHESMKEYFTTQVE